MWLSAGLLQHPLVPLVYDTKDTRCLRLVLSRDELQGLPNLGGYPKAYICYISLSIDDDLVDKMRVKRNKLIEDTVEHSGAQRGRIKAHFSQSPAKEVVVLETPPAALVPHYLVENDLEVHDDPLTAVDAEVFKWHRQDVLSVDGLQGRKVQFVIRAVEADSLEVFLQIHLVWKKEIPGSYITF